MKDVASKNSESPISSKKLPAISLKKPVKKLGEVGFTKIVVDEDLFIRECRQKKCYKCKNTDWNHKWKTYGKGISPNLELKCTKCNFKVEVTTSWNWIPPEDSHIKVVPFFGKVDVDCAVNVQLSTYPKIDSSTIFVEFQRK